MSQSAFDRSFGADFLEDVPRAPGVYRFWSDREEVVYVGKAVDLRARLGQYRNTRRIKAHRKRRKVIKAASRLTFEVTETELDALLLEIELIQELQPRLNTAGAYFFLYPTLGFKREGRYLHLAHSTKVEGLREQGFQVFGVYRRREITRAPVGSSKARRPWCSVHATSARLCSGRARRCAARRRLPSSRLCWLFALRVISCAARWLGATDPNGQCLDGGR